MQQILFMIVLIVVFSTGTTYAFDLEEIAVHGFASTGYMKSDHNNYLVQSETGSFEFTEAGLNVSSELTGNFRAGMQLFGRDLGNIGNNNVKVDWAFLDYHWRETVGVRFGKIKLPVNLYNDIRDYDMLRTSIILPQGGYNEYYRETSVSYQGAGLYGNLPLQAVGRLGYDVFVGTADISPDGGVSKVISNRGMTLTAGTIDSLAGGRLKWYTPLKWLMLGGSFVQSDTWFAARANAAPIRIIVDIPAMRGYSGAVECNLGDLTVTAEYFRQKYDLTIKWSAPDLGMPTPEPENDSQNLESYYALIAYRFTEWLELGAYYSVFYADVNDRDGAEQIQQGFPEYRAWQKDLALSTRFDLTDFWIVKLETHLLDGVGLCPVVDNPNGFDRHWMLFAIKTTFSF